MVIIKSWHADIAPGTAGTVIKRVANGYAVEIKTCFSVASGDRSVSTRLVYFAAKEIKLAQQRSASKSSGTTDDDVVVGGS